MKVVSDLFHKYHLSISDEKYLKSIILPIINNPNFEERLSNNFLHHSDITLGEHIIEDTIVTYLLSKKYLNKKKDSNYRLDLALEIALFHDLYTIPWQNNPKSSVHHFFNKHGFRHPLEATINAIIWYPEYFSNATDAKIIIDGIIHHMFPLPVRVFNEGEIDKVELKNMNNYNKLSKHYKELIYSSLNRNKIGGISLCRSKYKEGRIMSKADKLVSRKQIKNIASAKALLTGHNKKIK